MAKENKDADRSADELGEQSAYEGVTEMKRRLRRGDESKGDADDRDVSGSSSTSTNGAGSRSGQVRPPPGVE
jgi:hypothetical protein